MNDIAGIPYFEAEFDKKGALDSPAPLLPASVTDLFVVSHGWNNRRTRREALYQELFTNFMAVGDARDLAGRSQAIVGVIWPSKKFDELVAASGDDQAWRRAAPASHDRGERIVARGRRGQARRDEAVLHRASEQQKRSTRRKALLPDLEDKAIGAPRVRRGAAGAARSVARRTRRTRRTRFFKDDGNELMKNLQDRRRRPRPGAARTPRGGASLPLGVGGAAPGAGGAAGFKQTFSGFIGAAMNVLNLHDVLRDEGARRHRRQERRGQAHRRACAAASSASISSATASADAWSRPRPRQFDDRQDPEHVAAADGVLAQRLLEADERLLPARRGQQPGATARSW